MDSKLGKAQKLPPKPPKMGVNNSMGTFAIKDKNVIDSIKILSSSGKILKERSRESFSGVGIGTNPSGFKDKRGSTTFE
jgi:hypothetical protein